MITTQFLHPCKIVKATPDRAGGKIKIEIKASTDAEDKYGDRILRSAYADDNMKSEFLKAGYYDYNHLTDHIEKALAETKDLEIRAKLEKSKIQAIIGYPESLELREDGLYSTGHLIADNEYVKEILKSMEAGWQGWGASISGYCARDEKERKVISRVMLSRIAICPNMDAVNGDTAVKLLKSGAVWLNDLDMEKIEKSASDNPESANMFDMEQRLSAVEEKLNFYARIVSTSYPFADYLNQSLAKDIKGGELEVSYESLMAYLTGKFYMDAEYAASFANKFLLSYHRDPEEERVSETGTDAGRYVRHIVEKS